MRLARSLSLGALMAVLALHACQSPEPTAPVGLPTPRHPTINGVTLITAPPSARLQPAGMTSKTIGLFGGAIEMDGGRLTVPPGALLLPTSITMHGMIDGRYQYRFGPNGLHFLVPATLTVRVDPGALGFPPELLGVAVASDQGNDWQILGGVYDPLTQTVSIQVHHFTQYALCQN